MKVLPAVATNQFGTVPYYELRVVWVDGGSEVIYDTAILSVGTVDGVIQISNNSDSQSVEISLDDVSGYLKTLMGTVDIHLRPASLYLRFQGSSEKTLLFKGEISSPITWREGSREVKFTILSKIEEAEVGFSAEQAPFTTIPESVVGDAWPLSFGTVCHIKPLKLSAKITGTTLDTFGIPDPALPIKIDMKGTFPYPSGPGFLSMPWTSADEVHTYCGAMQEMSLEHLRQYQYAVGHIRVDKGDKFPQNVMVTVKINGKNFRGYFTGNTFYFENGDDGTPNYATYLAIKAITLANPAEYQPTGPIVCGVGCSGICSNYQYGQYHRPRHPDGEPSYWVPNEEWGAFGVTLGHGSIPDTTRAKDPAKTYDDVDYFIWSGAVRLSNKGAVQQRGYFEASAGSSVELVLENEPLDYVINLIGATDISVCGNLGGTSGVLNLVGLPYDWYTIVSMPIGPYNATILRLKQPLSTYDSRFNDDDLYVSFTSEIGPNPVDVIEWLLATYSQLNWDTTTFDDVKAKVDCYSIGFTLREKRQLVDVIRDIAYQSRCAIWLVNGVYKMKYLAETPTSVATITWSDIHVDTFEMGFSSTESLVTKLTATWNDCGELDEKKVVVRNNISKYGLHTSDYNYYIYNDFKCVLKSATYHILRQSNTFRRYDFVCSVNKLAIEPFDAITVNGDLAIVDTAIYNPDTFTVQIGCWVPIRSGESATYDLAFPASVSETTTFGTNPPTSGVSLNAGYGGIDRATNDTGDQYPSDIGDTCCSPPTTLGCLPYTLPGAVADTQQTTTVVGVSMDPGGNGQGVTLGGTGNYGCISSGDNNGLDAALECVSTHGPSGYTFSQDGDGWTWSNGEDGCSWQPSDSACHGGVLAHGIQFTYNGPGTSSIGGYGS